MNETTMWIFLCFFVRKKTLILPIKLYIYLFLILKKRISVL